MNDVIDYRESIPKSPSTTCQSDKNITVNNNNNNNSSKFSRTLPLWHNQLNYIYNLFRLIVCIVAIIVLCIGIVIVSINDNHFNWTLYIFYRPIIILNCIPFFIVDMIFSFVNFSLFIYLYTYWNESKKERYIQRYNDTDEKESGDYPIISDITLKKRITIFGKDFITNFINGIYNELGLRFGKYINIYYL